MSTALRLVEAERRPFLTVRDLAKVLAVSERTVRDMTKKGRITFYWVEGSIRFEPKDVDDYLARNRNGRR